ncbi:ribonuclease Y [Patescibacteria group bacterium]
METYIGIILAIVGVGVGIAVGYMIRQSVAKKKTDSAEAKAERIIEEAKTKQKAVLLEANEKSLKVIEEAKKEEKERHVQLVDREKRVERREESIDRKYDELDQKGNELNKRMDKIKSIRKDLDNIRREQLAKLEKVAGLSREKAREVMLELTEKDMKDRLLKRIQKLEAEGEEAFENKAREIINTAIQRVATDHTAESTATTITLPTDEMKGRIIGREGRNIKALESATGVEIVVDDTPEAIVISGFSPIRRQVAKMALEKLMKDGRIHPSRIEDAVIESKRSIAKNVKEAGEAVVYDVGVAGTDPKLVSLLGRLKFRTSYGQNVLKHSLEVAHISRILAEELGADVTIAKTAGLFHDIGKAVDHEVQGTHIEIGKNILKKFHFDDAVIHAVEAHHEDVPCQSLEAIIVKVADAISASRPGARRDTYEEYIKRLEDLEGTATDFDGVEKAYAIQAGREIRVFVQPQKIDDYGAEKLSHEIADRIEDNLKYPGEIKVTVIRETRVENFAR